MTRRANKEESARKPHMVRFSALEWSKLSAIARDDDRSPSAALRTLVDEEWERPRRAKLKAGKTPATG